MSNAFYVLTSVINSETEALFLALVQATNGGRVRYAHPNEIDAIVRSSDTRAIIVIEKNVDLKKIRGVRQGDAGRKDIFVGAFLQSTYECRDAQYLEALDVLKAQSVNLVLTKDNTSGLVMIVAPELAAYEEGADVPRAINSFAHMIVDRTNATFTRSRVVSGELVPWHSCEIPKVLRDVVNHCITRGAYKPFRGVTVGHFAVRGKDGDIITSIRKSDFNRLAETGMVRIRATGENDVIAFGAKPSVGGQSQRIIFTDHKDADCIVHFHCPMRSNSLVNIRDQRPYECGSHQCGKNTSDGLREHGPVLAVFLDNHGPNIVFKASADAQEVIAWIEENFDLSGRTDRVMHVPQQFVKEEYAHVMA